VVVQTAVALVASCCCVAFLPKILPLPVLSLFGLSGFALIYLLAKSHNRYLLTTILVFVSGFLYASAYASYQLSLRLPDAFLGVETELIGTVTGIPVKSGRRLRFICKIHSLQLVEAAETASEAADSIKVNRGKLRIDWYGNEAPELKAGNTIRVVVKLKAPSGFMNPGGFDLERWLTQKKIIATGYVRGKSFDVSESVISANNTSLASVRHRLQRRLLHASEGLATRGVVLALTVGDRSRINDDHWDSFIATGTNHLLAISGLHISLVAGFVALMARLLWQLAPQIIPVSKQTFALLSALLAASCYSAMAGFTVPTVRALTMFIVLAVLFMAIALMVVCLCDPLSVLSAGFWMSFAAVAVLYLVFCDTRKQGRSSLPWRLLRGHVLISVGLYPLTILFFQQASLVSPVSNLIVTPVVAMLVTPLIFFASLVALFSVPLSAMILLIANYLLEFSISVLVFLSSWPWALIKVGGFGYVGLLLSAFASVILLIPVRIYTIVICLVLVLPLFFPRTGKLDDQSYAVTFLDVGQGTSVVVRTRNHVLVYDAGDQFSKTFSAADAVIIPYLQSLHINSIDMLIVSHADRDHSGGADELLAKMQVPQLVSSAPLPQSIGTPFVRCQRGMQWSWDGIEFSFLHPREQSGGSTNDMSCVLKVSNKSGIDTLLPGDIETFGERSLALNEAFKSIEILNSPHHGSLTSSSVNFINRAEADYVVHSVGYQNRFGFPKDEVVQRYAASGARQYQTDLSGAVEFIISGTGIEVSEYREQGRRWWHRK